MNKAGPALVSKVTSWAGVVILGWQVADRMEKNEYLRTYGGSTLIVYEKSQSITEVRGVKNVYSASYYSEARVVLGKNKQVYHLNVYYNVTEAIYGVGKLANGKQTDYGGANITKDIEARLGQ
jgi:hypothetical protein